MVSFFGPLYIVSKTKRCFFFLGGGNSDRFGWVGGWSNQRWNFFFDQFGGWDRMEKNGWWKPWRKPGQKLKFVLDSMNFFARCPSFFKNTISKKKAKLSHHIKVHRFLCSVTKFESSARKKFNEGCRWIGPSTSVHPLNTSLPREQIEVSTLGLDSLLLFFVLVPFHPPLLSSSPSLNLKPVNHLRTTLNGPD